MTTSHNDEDLHLFVDGELPGAQMDEVAAMVAADPLLSARVALLRFSAQAVNASVEATGMTVPQARFEQVWDEIERTIDRPGATQSVVSHTSTPRRWWRVAWVPLGLVAAAAVMVMVVGRGRDASPSVVAQSTSPPAVIDTAPVATSGTPHELFKDPVHGKVDIHEMDVAGRAAQFSAGVATVLYIEEESEPQPQEHEL